MKTDSRTTSSSELTGQVVFTNATAQETETFPVDLSSLASIAGNQTVRMMIGHYQDQIAVLRLLFYNTEGQLTGIAEVSRMTYIFDEDQYPKTDLGGQPGYVQDTADHTALYAQKSDFRFYGYFVRPNKLGQSLHGAAIDVLDWLMS